MTHTQLNTHHPHLHERVCPIEQLQAAHEGRQVAGVGRLHSNLLGRVEWMDRTHTVSGPNTLRQGACNKCPHNGYL